MFRRRLAAVALAALTVVLVTVTGMASGAQAGNQALVRVAHFAPGLLKGDVYVIHVNGRLQFKGVPFKTVSDYLPSGSISSLVAVGGIGEKLELLDIRDAAPAVSAAGYVVQQRRPSG